MLLLFIIIILINKLLFNIYTLPSHMYVNIGRLMGINWPPSNEVL